MNIRSGALHKVAVDVAATAPSNAARPLRALLVQFAVAEFIATTSVAYAAASIYYWVVYRLVPAPATYGLGAVLIATFLLLASLALGHYSQLPSKPRHWFLANGVLSAALAFSFLLSMLFLFKLSEEYSRGVFFCQFAGVNLMVLITRAIDHARLQNAIAAGTVEARRAVLIGSEVGFAQVAARLGETGIYVVGSFPLEKFTCGSAAQAKGEARSTRERCRQLKPQDIVILADTEQLLAVPGLVETLSDIPATIHLVPINASELFAMSKPVELGNITTLRMLRLPLSNVDVFLKRSFDILAAAVGLILLAPLLLLVAVAIRLDSKGAALFRQKRHGYDNETIGVFKFRTMSIVEDGDAFRQAVDKDPRCTRLGALLRMSNIDELPQLINVLRGEMSIVGPRPHPIALNEQFEGRIVPFSRRHVVKPGITGWAQVNGYRGPTDTLEKMQRRLEYDLYYIDNWSFALDMKIVLMTLFSKKAYQNAC